MIFVFVLTFLQFVVNCTGDFYIEDFQGKSNVSSWSELSDTVMKEGKSKASFVIHQTDLFRRAVLFTLIDPQDCGAAIAGYKKNVQLNAGPYEHVVLRCRGQGSYNGFEFFLRQKGGLGINVPSYVHYFEAPLDFDTVKLKISDFKAYLMGRPADSEPLDRTQITSLGILAYGGLNMPKKQAGVACLEIDWIKLE